MNIPEVHDRDGPWSYKVKNHGFPGFAKEAALLVFRENTLDRQRKPHQIAATLVS